MARIRSVKPEFFTSETIASLPLSARLTFIGLWTYVDDNGVGLDNEMLITAAIWPLEDDHAGTLARTCDDLKTLAEKGIITRYESSRSPREALAKPSRKAPQNAKPPSRKRLLHIDSWSEHQKVDHPRHPRYPVPDEADDFNFTTSQYADPREDLAKPSREMREDLAPEQGSGIRDQGSKDSASPSADKPRRVRKPSGNTGDVIAAYVDGATSVGQPRPPESLRKRVGKQANDLLAEGYDLDTGEWNDLAVQVRKDSAGANGSQGSPGQPNMRGGARQKLLSHDEAENLDPRSIV
jgi:hypothetical protein